MANSLALAPRDGASVDQVAPPNQSPEYPLETSSAVNPDPSSNGQ
jgi:hypothetical protein